MSSTIGSDSCPSMQLQVRIEGTIIPGTITISEPAKDCTYDEYWKFSKIYKTYCEQQKIVITKLWSFYNV